MTYLRFAARHAQRSLTDALGLWLTSTGWLGPAGVVPFGVDPFVLTVGRLDESAIRTVTGNMINVSFAGETDDLDEELGGGLMSTEMVLFVDIIADTDGVAVAVGADVKDRLTGRAPGTSRFVDVRDQTTTPALVVPGWRMELLDVTRERANEALRPNWYVVKATAVLTFPGED